MDLIEINCSKNRNLFYKPKVKRSAFILLSVKIDGCQYSFLSNFLFPYSYCGAYEPMASF